VDCGQLVAAVYEAAGVVPPGLVIPDYPPDWHLHRDDERYLRHVEEWAHRIDGPPEPGDVALFRFGRCISHGAIVVRWPAIIHAHRPDGAVVAGDALADAQLRQRLAGVWSPWGGR
jgi:cell wall-associated NlpC family hydrolase